MHTSRVLVSVLASFASLSPVMEAGKLAPIPLRYQEIAPGKIAKLVEVWGAAEQEATFGHTAVLSRDGKLGLFATGGGDIVEDMAQDGFVIVCDLDRGSVLQEWRIVKGGVSALDL